MERYKDGNLENLGSILDGLGDEREYELEEGSSWNDVGNPVEDIKNFVKKQKQSTGIKNEVPFMQARNYKEAIEEMNRRRDGR